MIAILKSEINFQAKSLNMALGFRAALYIMYVHEFKIKINTWA